MLRLPPGSSCVSCWGEMSPFPAPVVYPLVKAGTLEQDVSAFSSDSVYTLDSQYFSHEMRS